MLENKNAYITAIVFLAIIFWQAHRHHTVMEEITACALQSYEEANASIRLGYTDPGNHQSDFEDEYQLCIDDVMQSGALR